MRLCVCVLLSFAAGCGISLRDEDVRSIDAEPLGVSDVCPGERFDMRVIAELDGYRWEATRGAAGGRVRWSDYDVRVLGGEMRGDGEVFVAADPRATARGELEVEVLSVHHALRSDFLLPVHYGCRFGAIVAGPHGDDGGEGAQGPQGAAGPWLQDGQGPGGPGGAGGVGGDGQDGGDGPVVFASVRRVALEHHEGELLGVLVEADGLAVERYFVDPERGSLTIAAAGGNGGQGGGAGRGGQGGAGSPPGPRGADGVAGSGGHGGGGGLLIVRVTEDALPLLDEAVRLTAPGGSGGARGGGGGGAEDGFDGPDGVVTVEVLPPAPVLDGLREELPSYRN